MKIASHQIQAKAAHQLERKKEVSEKMEFWKGREPVREEPSFILDIGSSHRIFKFTTEKSSLKGKVQEDESSDQQTEVKLKLIESFIYITTGRRVKLRSPSIKLSPNAKSGGGNPEAERMEAVQERDGWGLTYEYHEVSSESEIVRFSSAGSVVTSDGRTISFELDFNMSRAFCQEKHINLRFGDAAKVDPLVISLDGKAPVLSREKYAFDLDADGDTEQISFASGNSAFLALDKNGDGVINDGTELFGPQSGNGFAELRVYDLDKNGWIDESDEVFGKLCLLSLSEDGQRTLFRMGDVGIGAIHLSEISTPFSIKDELDAYGEMKSSAIYLRENGTAGTIHHIDLII